MRNSGLLSTDSCLLASTAVVALSEGWILDGSYRQLAPQTQYGRRMVAHRLIAFLAQEGRETCGPDDLRAFLVWVGDGGGKGKDKTRPITVKTYHSRLHAMFVWGVGEGAIAANPLDRVKPPIVRQDQIQPFTDSQINALLRAAKKSEDAHRDEALVLFALDSLVRASELCALCRQDLDLSSRTARVLGKGGKWRQVYFSPTTGKALWRYLQGRDADANAPVFASQRTGAALTRSGLQQVIERLGRAAGLRGVRSSPHTLRHTGAVMLARSGAQAFTLQALLGHTTLSTTRRYVMLAQADIQAQHTQFSPVEALKRR